MITRRLVLLLAVGAGLGAANLYYNQPMLGVLAADLHATSSDVGFVPPATQLGYAAGILAFAPLGDMLDRRRVILAKTLLLIVALVAAALARDVVWLSLASLAIGLTATLAQDLVPTAAALAEPSSRGKVVGTVMTGLLLGILLSRVVSGAVSAWVSWRAVFFGAAGAFVVFGLVARSHLPSFPPIARARYAVLLRSMASLVRDNAALRRAALTQGLLSVTFGAFWSTLALGLAAPPFGLSSAVAGTMGIAGAAGAIIAPIAGAVSDRRGPRVVIRLGAVLVIASFAAMALFGGSLAVLVAGTIVFDLGVQACLISHQTIIYADDPAARSRLNALLVSSIFIGMSSGAFFGNRVLVRFGFPGVCAMGAVVAVTALVIASLPPPARRADPAV